MTAAWLLIAVFLFFAVLMYLGKLPAIVALPLMASAMFIVGLAAQGADAGGLRPAVKLFFQVVLEDGSVRLIKYAVTFILGAVLSEQLRDSGVVQSVIRWVSEMAGDNKFAVSLALTLVSAILFTTLGGLGAVIMVASLTLPILLSIGVTAEAAGCMMLLALSLGGVFNIANWKLYIDILGLQQSQIFSFALPFGLLFLAAAVVFVAMNARKGFTSLWAVQTSGDASESRAVRPIAFLTPLVPLGLILFFQLRLIFGGGRYTYSFPINAALIAGIGFGFLATYRVGEQNVQRLSKAIIEGVKQSAPAVAMIVGIGMIINVVWHDAVKTPLNPLLVRFMPHSALGYVALFTLLAPLALYRGPFNIWGMGAGLIAMFHGIEGGLPTPAIMALFLSVGQIQGVCDPTNTHNVWIAGYLKTDVMTLTKKTMPYIWALSALGLIVSAVMFL